MPKIDFKSPLLDFKIFYILKLSNGDSYHIYHTKILLLHVCFRICYALTHLMLVTAILVGIFRQENNDITDSLVYRQHLHKCSKRLETGSN